VPYQAYIAAPTVTLAAAEPLPRRDSRRIDVAVVATREAPDDQNLVALRIHTDVHRGRVHRSNASVHEAPRPGECWMRKCLSRRPFSTRDREHEHGGLRTESGALTLSKDSHRVGYPVVLDGARLPACRADPHAEHTLRRGERRAASFQYLRGQVHSLTSTTIAVWITQEQQ
jgi:hypothetical protein